MFRYVNLPCGVCDSDNYDFLGYRGGEAHRSGKGEKCRIVKCISCGHIYPKPFPLLKDTNEAYKDTSEYFASHDAKLKIEKYTRLLRKLETDLGYKGKLLDFGSGRGELLFAAQQLGWYVRGIETSKEFAEFARLTYGVKVENCSLARANYPDNHFD